MKRLILLLTFVLPQLLLAQNTSSIDIVTGLNYSYRTLEFSSDDVPNLAAYQPAYDDRQQTDSEKLNWTFGVHYNKEIFKTWHLRTGIRLTSFGYNIPVSDEYLEYLNNPSPEFAIDFYPGYGHAFGNHLFLDLPILMRHKFSSKKWSPFIEFGVAPNYYIKTSKIDRRVTKNFGPKFHLVGVVSGGINYSMDAIQLFAQPTLRYDFTKFSYSVFEENLYSFGLEVGVRKMVAAGK